MSISPICLVIAVAVSIPAAARAAPIVASLQAEASVTDAPGPDSSARVLDYGDEVSSQTLVFAPGAILSETPADPASSLQFAGRAGTSLWRMKGLPEAEPAYCWREADVYWSHPFFCYVDRDRDGRFDIVYDVREFREPGRLLSFGKIRPHKLKPVAYRLTGAAGAAPTRFTLRYMGPYEGLIGPDGTMTEGVILFSVSVGKELSDSQVVQFLPAVMRDGRARLHTPYGQDVEIEKVAVDGHVTLRLVAGAAVGSIELFPAVK